MLVLVLDPVLKLGVWVRRKVPAWARGGSLVISEAYPSSLLAMFISLAHGDDEIDRTIEAIADFDD